MKKLTKKQQHKDLKKLHKKAWKLMSEWTRRKYADFNDFVRCFTCPTYAPWKSFQAGHYRHGYLDFNEFNLHPQCVSCNKFWHGRLDVYGHRLQQKYGSRIFDKLEKLVNAERQRRDKLGYAYTIPELEAIIKDLQEKINGLDIQPHE